METLARVRLHFRGLRARSWLPSIVENSESHVNDGVLDPGCNIPGFGTNSDEEPRSAVWTEIGQGHVRTRHNRLSDADDLIDLDDADGNGSDPPDRRFVSVSLDIRRVGQLLASPRSAASWFVCSESCADGPFSVVIL